MAQIANPVLSQLSNFLIMIIVGVSFRGHPNFLQRTGDLDKVGVAHVGAQGRMPLQLWRKFSDGVYTPMHCRVTKDQTHDKNNRAQDGWRQVK